MKLYLCLISLLVSVKLSAQTEDIKSVNDTLRIIEKYQVLNNNGTIIKEGQYTAYSKIYPTKRICTGFYKNNLREGQWILFSVDGKTAAFGNYEHGLKTGLWEAKDMRGIVEIKYDYTAKQLLDFQYTSQNKPEKEYDVINGSDTIKTKLERPPIFLEGGGVIATTIALSLSMPDEARSHNVNGVVLIAVTVGEDGVINNYRIKRSLGFGCDEEALAAVKRLRGEWLPGILNRKAVSVENIFPVSFTNVEE
ncbi:TonB family protein [Mucilaginibacter angelicae]|uniref:TonB family protein n=1 Tax=Mucilaginibacter angelicae TaxID=869718 RepID=A0ABV6LGE6_9SPHI